MATKRINEYRNTPGTRVWQTRFHDSIIRDEQAFLRIRHSILNNPANWKNGAHDPRPKPKYRTVNSQ